MSDYEWWSMLLKFLCLIVLFGIMVMLAEIASDSSIIAHHLH